MTVRDYLREHGDGPYGWGGIGPAGYDCSRLVRMMTEPTDWEAWIARDRLGVIRALIGIELRYRLRLLRDRAERALVRVTARR